ncbi:MAG: peptide chain release factor 2 [Kiritimatiellae bacterium]|nr:peptide chain release factor 2 [Kiritimatiellia bacterium]
MIEEVAAKLNRARVKLAELLSVFDVAKAEKELAEIERRAADANFWNDQDVARGVIERIRELRAVLDPVREVSRSIEDAGLLLDLAGAEQDESQRKHAVEEATRMVETVAKRLDELELRALLNGEHDRNNAYLTFHAGAGGTESCDWAEMLLRMYRRYCSERGFEIELLDCQPGEEAGVKSATLLVKGEYAYGYLKVERGVHRLVRISPFDANKRRHTSFAALDVVAEIADEIEVEIRDEDIRVDTFRSGGAGGQHVNKTDSAVRITHLPTGIVVACQAERSQHKNRARAMKLLRAKIYERMQDERKQEMERFYGEKGEIAWGNQIRSYVLQPYRLVKDHRTGYETSNVEAVLDGNIHSFIERELKRRARGEKPLRAAAG